MTDGSFHPPIHPAQTCPRHGLPFDPAIHKGCAQCYRDAAAKARRFGPAAVNGADATCPRHGQPFNRSTHKGCAQCYDELARRHEATAATLPGASPVVSAPAAAFPAAPQAPSPTPVAPASPAPAAYAPPPVPTPPARNVPPSIPAVPPSAPGAATFVPPPPVPVVPQPAAPQPAAPQPAAPQPAAPQPAAPQPPVARQPAHQAALSMPAETETYAFADQPVTAEAPSQTYARGQDFEPAATAGVERAQPPEPEPVPTRPGPNPYGPPTTPAGPVRPEPPGLALYIAVGLIFFTGTGIYMAHKAAYDATQKQFSKMREAIDGDLPEGVFTPEELLGGASGDDEDDESYHELDSGDIYDD